MQHRLFNLWLKAIVLSTLSLLQTIQVQASNEFDARYLQSINTAETFAMSPKASKQNYYIYVKLPQNLDKDKTYPTVYLLDGGAIFPMLTPIYWQLRFLEDLPDLILVGISYGSNDWRNGNNRGHDFTIPSKQSEHWGGALEFGDFLREELFPHIESNYPANPGRRILFGNSLAGQFGLYAATWQADLFYGIIANNPAIHDVAEQFLVKSIQKADAIPLKLFVALAENDADRFKVPMQKWLAHWQVKTPPQWQLKVQDMPGHNHFSSIPTTFRAGLKWILNN